MGGRCGLSEVSWGPDKRPSGPERSRLEGVRVPRVRKPGTTSLIGLRCPPLSALGGDRCDQVTLVPPADPTVGLVVSPS